MPTPEDAYTALLAERYTANSWWTRKPVPIEWDDSDITTARRRRVLAAEYAASTLSKIA